MTRRATRFRESVGEVLASWGLELRLARKGDAGRAVLKLYLTLPEHGRVAVGELSQDGAEFVYRYAPGFASQPYAFPLPGFPELTEEYRSDRLWAFFSARVPPLARADVRAVLERERVDRTDTLRVLGTVSTRAVSNPYEFEYLGGAAAQ